MKKEIICLIVIIYSLIFIILIGSQFIKYLKFKIFIEKYDVISFLDGFYEVAIYIVGSLYIAIYLSSVIDMFMLMESNGEWNIPFAVVIMPLMVITFKTMISDGLYAYNNNQVFIGDIKYIDINNIKEYKVKNQYMNRAKIIFTPIDNITITYKKRYVVRTSNNKLQLFLNREKADNVNGGSY